MKNDFDDFVAASDKVFDSKRYKEKFNEEHRIWGSSKLWWQRRLSSRTKGTLGKAIVEVWARGRGLEVEKAKDSSYDRLISGERVAIKTSWLWKSNEFKFEQIRLNQNYDYLLMLGIMPKDVKAWIIPKERIAERNLEFIPQHGGKKTNNRNLLWISINAENPKTFLKEYGGTLSQVYEILAQCAATASKTSIDETEEKLLSDSK